MQHAEQKKNDRLRGLQGKCRTGCGSLSALKGFNFGISASIGISLYPDHGADLDQLMARADTAMWDVKARTDGAYNIFKDNA